MSINLWDSVKECKEISVRLMWVRESSLREVVDCAYVPGSERSEEEGIAF